MRVRELEENLPPPVFRAHPAFGLLRVPNDEPLFPPSESDYPGPWLELDDAREEELLTRWYGDLMNAIARLGDSRLQIELSDGRGVDRLRELNECSVNERNRFAFACKATPDVIQAALRTNPARAFQLVNGTVYMSAFDTWEGMFLHVDEDAIVVRFGEPVTI